MLIQISLCSSIHSSYVHSHRHTSFSRMVYLARVTPSHSHRHTSSSGWLPGQSHICLSPRSFKLLTATPPMGWFTWLETFCKSFSLTHAPTATPPLQDGLLGRRPLLPLCQGVVVIFLSRLAVKHTLTPNHVAHSRVGLAVLD